MNESDFDYVDDPTLAWAAAGSLGVAWADNARKDVFFQMYGADGRRRLTTPTNVSQSPRVFSWLPRLVIAADRVFVLWQEIVFSGGSHGGEAFFARSDNAGETFSAPLNLSRSKGGDGKGRLSETHWDNGSLDLIRDSDGMLLTAWTEYDGALWFSRSSDDGQSFSVPIQVGGSEQHPARGPALARAREALYLVWATGETGSGTLRLAVSQDRGHTFGSPRVALESTGQADAPKIVADGQGVLHLVYSERPDGSAGSHARYARLEQGASTFDTPRTLSAPATEQPASFPSLSLGAPGQVVAAWQHQPSARAQPLGLGLSLSLDGGHSFSLPELVPGTSDAALGVNGSRQGKLMRVLAVNREGALALVHSSFLEQRSSRIRSSR